jgi:hypothetical protein
MTTICIGRFYEQDKPRFMPNFDESKEWMELILPMEDKTNDK